VQDIDKVAAELRQAVPEATIVTAHGKMGERALER
jgi:transcription-repair coupling factor (superfamily II helicase)